MSSRLQPSHLLSKHRGALLGLSFLMVTWLNGASAADPNVRESVAFVEDKINHQGAVNVAAYMHDYVSRKDTVSRQSWEQTRFRIDPRGKCRVDYHKKIVINGSTSVDSNFSVVLQAVTRVEVLPIEDAWRAFDSRDGANTLNYKANPAVSVVRLNVYDGTYLDFAFNDKAIADTVAKDMTFVVLNCGGGRGEF